MPKVKISAKMARLLFNGCDPDYIRNVCHASCCESSTASTGTMITIHPSEQAAIEAIGGVVRDGLLQPKPGCKKCPFKQPDNLCGIHFSGNKPFGCIASPFTLNASGTLIVRNRYKLLKCYNDGRKQPAYKAFRASLDLIFGTTEAQRICNHLDNGGGDLYATMSDKNHQMLTENDEIKHAAKMSNGKTPARKFGQDLMRGEHVVGKQSGRLTWATGVERTDEASRKNLAAGRKSLNINTQEWVQQKIADGEIGGGMAANQSGTSIFDPVLCELAYTWFCPPSGAILDPFAGGSVRGIVAAYLGRHYTGVDLRPEQIAANREQAAAIVPDNMPVWIVGDSVKDLPDSEFDFVFSCPPYADLEVYSDNPADISTMDYPQFLEAYRGIIAQCVDRLRPDRFACFVVGDVRDKKGNYRNFVSDTIAAFRDAGAHLYNEAILVTAVGSLPIRVGKQFESGRKLGKTHQNVLIFVKGDGRKAAAACGSVEILDIESWQADQAN